MKKIKKRRTIMVNIKVVSIKKIFRLFLVLAACLSLLGLPLTSNAASSTVPSIASSLPVVNPVITLPQPPANFNPLTATPGDLQKYGFPAKPTDANALAGWEDAMKHAKQYVKPIQVPSLYRYTYIGDLYTNLWAGYEAYSTHNSNEYYYGANACWYQPSWVTSGDWTAFWTGMGDGGYIFQAGATSGAQWYGGPSPYCFWVEDYPNGPVYEAAPALNPGNSVFVQVNYNGANVGYVWLENETTGQYTYITNFNVPYYSGYYVEWINEEANYSNWGPVNFWNCGYSDVLNGSDTYFGSLNLYRIINNKSGGEIVPTLPTSTSFTLNTP
jgi:hypothetical protein